MCADSMTSEYRIEIVTCLVRGEAREAVVAAEFDNHDQRVKAEDRRQAATASLVVAPLVPLFWTV